MYVGDNYVPYAVLSQMFSISFLLSWHCLHEHLLVIRASWP